MTNILKNIGAFGALFLTPLLFLSVTDNPFYIHIPLFVFFVSLFFAAAVWKGKIWTARFDKWFLLFIILLALGTRNGDAFLLLFLYAGGYFLGAQAAAEKSFKIFNLPLAACALSSVFLLLQAYAGGFILPKAAGLTATFGNPNFFSSFLLLCLGAALFFFLTAQEKYKKFYAFTLCSGVGALLLANARSAWISAVFGVILLMFSDAARRALFANKKGLAVIAACVMLLVFLTPRAQRVQTSAKAAEMTAFLSADEDKIFQSYHQRLLMWRAGAQIIKESPFFGAGFGEWQKAYTQKQGALLVEEQRFAPLLTQSNGAHNIFVQLLAESGIFGGAAFLFFMFFLAVRIIKKLRQKDFKKTENEKLFLIFISAGALCFLADNMLNITFFIPETAFFFWFFAGALSAKAEPAREVTLKNKFVKIILTLAAVCAVVFASVLYAGEVIIFKGRRHLAAGRYIAAAENFKLAARLNPQKMEPWFYLGVAEVKMRRPGEALDAFLKAAENNPGYEEAWFNAAVSSLALGRQQDARLYLEKTLFLNPYNSAAKELL